MLTIKKSCLQRKNSCNYLDKRTEDNEKYLLFKYENVNIWKIFIVQFLGDFSKYLEAQQSKDIDLLKEYKSQIYYYLFDDLIYVTSTLYERFILGYLENKSSFFYMSQLMEKFEVFKVMTEIIEPSLIEALHLKHRGNDSKLVAGRILSILETYHCGLFLAMARR